MESTQAVEQVDFANDVPEGVALQLVDEAALTAFIDDTRAEVQYCLQYSEHLTKIILDEDHKTEDGVSMNAVLGYLEQIEADLKDEPPLAMIRMRRAITAFSASMSCPIPPRFILIDSVSHTAISMLASICNKLKAEELRKVAEAQQALNAGVPTQNGLPASAEPAPNLEDTLVAGLVAATDHLLQ